MLVKLKLDELLEGDYLADPMRDHRHAPDTVVAASGGREAVRSRTDRRGVTADVLRPVRRAARVPVVDRLAFYGPVVAGSVSKIFGGEPHGCHPGD
jgi:hypothetical protein